MEKVLIGYNFTEFLETAAIYKAAVFDYNDKKGNRYFNDYSIEVHIFIDNKEILNMQYSDIRENFECKQEEVYNFIPKEKLIEQIKDNYNNVTAYGSAVIQWKK